jgi:hypothetical protein
MTPSAKQQAIPATAPAAWAAILVVVGMVLSFNGRLATVEAHYEHIVESLKEIKTDVKSWHPKGRE